MLSISSLHFAFFFHRFLFFLAFFYLHSFRFFSFFFVRLDVRRSKTRMRKEVKIKIFYKWQYFLFVGPSVCPSVLLLWEVLFWYGFKRKLRNELQTTDGHGRIGFRVLRVIRAKLSNFVSDGHLKRKTNFFPLLSSMEPIFVLSFLLFSFVILFVCFVALFIICCVC